MASHSHSEESPLLPPTALSQSETRPRPPRSVTFNPNPLVKTIESEPEYQRPSHASQSSHRHHHYGSLGPSGPNHSAINSSGFGGGPPMITALNNKLRRRNSYGAPSPPPGVAFSGAGSYPAHVQPKMGPQRSSKKAQKLKLLPTPEVAEDGLDEERGGDVYSQYTRIKDPSARRDAARLGKADRDRLPRVTAYSTANRYQMERLMRFLKGRGKTRGANPTLIDECIYTPYSYGGERAGGGAQGERQAHVAPTPVTSYERRHSTGEVSGADGEFHREDLIDLRGDDQPGEIGSGFHDDGNDDLVTQVLGDEVAISDNVADLDIQVHTPEVFLFEYGVVVIWGMSLAQEQKFLKDIAKFETEKLAPDDVQTEFFNFYYTREYQAQIYNDFIALRHGSSHMTKLAISHALAQSVKVCPHPPPPSRPPPPFEADKHRTRPRSSRSS